MTNNLKIILLIILSVFLCGCSDNKKSQINHKEVNLGEILKEDKISGGLSLICDDIQYIPIEMNEHCILSRNIYLIYLDDEDIFIKSDKYVFRFDINGKFKNRIGEIGRSSREYILPYKFMVDSKTKQIIVLVENNIIQYWGYDGKFIKKIKLDNSLNISSMQFQNNYLYCEGRKYNKSGGIITEIILFDKEGETIYKHPIYSDNENIKSILQTSSSMYSLNDSVRYLNIFSDRILSLGLDTITQYCDLMLGRLMPSRELIENVDFKETLLSQYVQILDVQESNNHMFFLLYYRHNLSTIIYNKRSRTVVLFEDITHPIRGGGISNDLTNIGDFYPTYLYENKICGLLHPIHLSESQLIKLKTYISHSPYVVEFDSNPVVVICNEKPIK